MEEITIVRCSVTALNEEKLTKKTMLYYKTFDSIFQCFPNERKLIIANQRIGDS